MTRERRHPQSWSAANAKFEGREAGPRSLHLPSPGSPPSGDYSVQDAGLPANGPSTEELMMRREVRRRRRQWIQILPLNLFTNWQVGAAVAVVGCSGIALVAAIHLFRLPTSPDCLAVFWPTASASLRIHCAQLTAEKQTVRDLLAAIALVNKLPEDHPLRPEVDRQIEAWASDILTLADESFQTGDLEAAIATARKVPQDLSAYALVEDQIEKWQSIWADAEEIYQEADRLLKDGNYQQAFTVANRLLSVGNQHWASTKHQELSDLITLARRDGQKLTKAEIQADRGGLSNLLAAIKLAAEIPSESPAYAMAQKLIEKFSKTLLDQALDDLRYSGRSPATDVVQQIPDRAKLKEEIQDFMHLASAYRRAQLGDVSDLESAILQVQELTTSRPFYREGRQMISRFQQEIQDLSRLKWARQLADPGTPADLTVAIAEAQQIPRGNPLWDEAQGEISTWTRRLQVMEDQPFLDQARRIAAAGDMVSLQLAVEQAQNIRPNRALYQEAQAEIAAWQGTLSGWQRLQEAYEVAGNGTFDGLSSAIDLASQVDGSNAYWSEADRMIGLWSQDLLRFAEQQAEYDLEEAIAIARQIPSRSPAYGQAQDLIEIWDSLLADQQIIFEQ